MLPRGRSGPGARVESGAMPPRSWPAAGEVHLFWYRLDGPRAPRAAPVLSARERRRAARIPFPERRSRFVSGRAGLRAILARYLGCAPGEVEIADGPHGKPFLPQARALRFNLAHSHDRAVLAVACGRTVGLDLERIRPGVDCGRLMDDFFAPREAAAWRALPAPRRRRAFFTAWTRKEAVVKARGGQAARGAGALSLRALRAPAGYVACLATPGAVRVRVMAPF
jgi:4'-phosphopantetheinyl transferase